MPSGIFVNNEKHTVFPSHINRYSGYSNTTVSFIRYPLCVLSVEGVGNQLQRIFQESITIAAGHISVTHITNRTWAVYTFVWICTILKATVSSNIKNSDTSRLTVRLAQSVEKLSIKTKVPIRMTDTESSPTLPTDFCDLSASWTQRKTLRARLWPRKLGT